jgi:hypothetical protein
MSCCALPKRSSSPGLIPECADPARSMTRSVFARSAVSGKLLKRAGYCWLADSHDNSPLLIAKNGANGCMETLLSSCNSSRSTSVALTSRSVSLPFRSFADQRAETCFERPLDHSESHKEAFQHVLLFQHFAGRRISSRIGRASSHCRPKGDVRSGLIARLKPYFAIAQLPNG